MKKTILSIAAGFLLMAFTSNSFASGKNTGSEPKLTANQKAVKSFNKQFNYVVPTVYKSNEGFILKAVSDGHNVTAAYNKNGGWVYTIKHYASESLSKNIIDIVQNNYDSRGYYITAMQEIDQPGRGSVYLVQLQNNTSYKTLRVVNNDVEVIGDLKKA